MQDDWKRSWLIQATEQECQMRQWCPTRKKFLCYDSQCQGSNSTLSRPECREEDCPRRILYKEEEESCPSTI